MKSNIITALATGMLVLVGIVQSRILASQHRQHRFDLAESYWSRWSGCRQSWAVVIFVGRECGEYYQIADKKFLKKLNNLVDDSDYSGPSTWALNPIAEVTGIMSEVCLQIFHGRLTISDVYPVFGTELLRQGFPLHALLQVREEVQYSEEYYCEEKDSDKHTEMHEMVRDELQTWLEYHDGTRRRCLILMDLLWAEAARLEDLSDYELRVAADIKKESGHKNRKRLRKECSRVLGVKGFFRALRLSRFLRNAEHQRKFSRIGLRKEK